MNLLLTILVLAFGLLGVSSLADDEFSFNDYLSSQLPTDQDAHRVYGPKELERLLSLKLALLKKFGKIPDDDDDYEKEKSKNYILPFPTEIEIHQEDSPLDLKSSNTYVNNRIPEKQIEGSGDNESAQLNHKEEFISFRGSVGNDVDDGTLSSSIPDLVKGKLRQLTSEQSRRYWAAQLGKMLRNRARANKKAEQEQTYGQVIVEAAKEIELELADILSGDLITKDLTKIFDARSGGALKTLGLQLPSQERAIRARRYDY